MAVRGQSVDMAGFHVQRKRTHALNRIDEEDHAIALANLTNRLQVGPVARNELDETDA